MAADYENNRRTRGSSETLNDEELHQMRMRAYRRKKHKEKLRKKKRQKRMLAVGVFLVIVIAVVLLLASFFHVKRQVTLEAGADFPAVSEFLRWGKNGEFVSDISAVNLNKVGDYKVTVRAGIRSVTCTVSVQDTVAPVVTTQNQSVWLGDTVTAEQFLASVEDMTATTAAFEEEPDVNTAGTQTVKIVVTDEGGNATTAEASLEIVADTEPPVISGVEDLTTTEGGSVSYKKNVTVTDNLDTDVELTIDNSEVNLNEQGDYTVTYTAVDDSGNETSVSATVHVKAASAETATEDYVNAKADELLATLIDDSMSEYEKAEAIFWWCHNNIAYYDGTEKTTWVAGAYHGLVERKGDCFVYAMTSKCLLTRAGIKNMDIEKIPKNNTMHYWNLIDLGDGWYHFDTCRRKDGSYFFYVTDAELMEYSNSHNGSHNYDPSQYPEIQ